MSGVPQACGGCPQVRGVPRAHCFCGSSHGKGTVGTLHTRVLTSDSWPPRMRVLDLVPTGASLASFEV